MNDSIIIQDYKSAFGVLILGSYQNKLVLADWKYRRMRKAIDKRIKSFFDRDYHFGDSKIISETIKQLKQYSVGQREVFDLPLTFAGTEFQKKVWEALLTIPYGTTETYSSLSLKLGDEKAIRAVATANGANALSIVVPCHRVIGSNGDLVGYAGGVPIKKRLLQLEQKVEQGNLFT